MNNKTKANEKSLSTLTWQQTLDEKHQFEQAQKERGMIYQVEAKEDAASLIGLPLDTFYYIPYERWSGISKVVEEIKERAFKWWWVTKKSESKLLGQIWKDYLKEYPSCEFKSIRLEFNKKNS